MATRKSRTPRSRSGGAARRKHSSGRWSSSVASSSDSGEVLPPDWREFLSLLISNRVRFLLVGAHALAVHGVARATEDLDIFVEPRRRNIEPLRQSLIAFGFHGLAAAAEQFTLPKRMATLGVSPWEIDLLNSLTGVTFAAAWRSRTTAELCGLFVPVLGLTTYVRNKRATDRVKDRLDLELLRERGLLPRRRRRSAKA